MADDTTTFDSELLPYDDLDQFPNSWDRCWKTLAFLIVHPIDGLNRISNSKAGGDSYKFLLVVLWPILSVVEIFKFIIRYFPWFYDRFPRRADSTTWWEVVISVVLFPVGASVGLWVGAWLYHASLWIWRGLYNGFDTTYTARLNGFTYGVNIVVFFPYTVLGIFYPTVSNIPFLGSALAITFQCYVGIGLAKTHAIAVWRGVGAALTLPAFFIVIFSLVSHHPLLQILR